MSVQTGIDAQSSGDGRTASADQGPWRSRPQSRGSARRLGHGEEQAAAERIVGGRESELWRQRRREPIRLTRDVAHLSLRRLGGKPPQERNDRRQRGVPPRLAGDDG